MAEESASSKVFNVPNSLSTLRLVLAFGVGILIEMQIFLPAMLLFVFAASTDFVDGWWARRFKQITKLGRVLDPFVDKIIIAAALIALVSVQNSGFQAWMVTLILGREFLVTSLRAMIEGKGGDFSARWLGKWKMGFQCAAVTASLLALHWNHSIAWVSVTASVLIWLALGLTVASGIDYVVVAARSSRQATEANPPTA